jgi:hypothetical protein
MRAAPRIVHAMQKPVAEAVARDRLNGVWGMLADPTARHQIVTAKIRGLRMTLSGAPLLELTITKLGAVAPVPTTIAKPDLDGSHPKHHRLTQIPPNCLVFPKIPKAVTGNGVV